MRMLVMQWRAMFIATLHFANTIVANASPDDLRLTHLAVAMESETTFFWTLTRNQCHRLRAVSYLISHISTS